MVFILIMNSEFVSNIDRFNISKYCITNYEYLNFVNQVDMINMNIG